MAEPARTFDPERLMALIGGFGHGGALGIRFAAAGSDWCALTLPYDARLASDAETGILASGPILALMDMATSIAIWIRTDRFVPQATLDLRVDYLRAAVPGRTITGHGICRRVARRIAFVDGHAHDGDPDDPVARVAGTFMFTDAG